MKKVTGALLVAPAVLGTLVAVNMTNNQVNAATDHQISAKSANTRTTTAKEAGLVGDGKTDNTKALNAWLAQSDKYDHSTLDLSEGTYLIHGQILMHSNVSLTGVGNRKSIIKTDTKSAFSYPSSKAGYDSGVQNIYWKDIGFERDTPTVNDTVVNYADGNTLHIDTQNKNPEKKAQIGRAADNVAVKTGQTYTLSATYNTSDTKSDAIDVQMLTDNGKYTRTIIKPITDGKDHTVTVESSVKVNKISVYAGTNGDFKGTIKDIKLVEKDTQKNVLKSRRLDVNQENDPKNSDLKLAENQVNNDVNPDMTTKGWRTWLPSGDFDSKNLTNGRIIMTRSPGNEKSMVHSMVHAKNVHFDNLRFVNITEAHIFDMDGCSYIYINNCRMEGFGSRKDGTFDMNKEAIQIDFDTKGAMSYVNDGDNYDGLASHHIYITNNKFLPIKDKDGNITSFAPQPMGNHSSNADAAHLDPLTNHPHDIVFDHNYVLDTEPTYRDYYKGLDTGVTTRTSDQWDYAGHAAFHLADMDHLKMTNNIFESDAANKIETEGYIRFLQFDKDGLKFSDINISNNTFKNIKSSKPMIDFSMDQSRTDHPGTIYDNVKIQNNSYVNETAVAKQVRNYGIDKNTGDRDDHVTVNGDIKDNHGYQYANQNLNEPGATQDNEEHDYLADGYSPYRLIIKAVDQKGQTIKTQVMGRGAYAESYTYQMPAIDGYDTDATGGSGMFDLSDKTVTIKYQAQKRTIKIECVDDDGKVIKAETKSGLFGDEFNYQAPKISGYELADKNDQVSGKYNEDNQVIKLHYSKKANNQQDSSGQNSSAGNKTGNNNHENTHTNDAGTSSGNGSTKTKTQAGASDTVTTIKVARKILVEKMAQTGHTNGWFDNLVNWFVKK
ncbi:MucBP domain-containing protein [Pediococcus pentosaceus]|uniref:MucBP domain-containing protein n=1 Tax=Pediococcus pentosaceus TaxID=1255 RepID=UPI003166F448